MKQKIRGDEWGKLQKIEKDNKEKERNIKYQQTKAYFKHPRLICSPYAKNAHPGKGLYIQMGYNVEEDFIRIPMEARHLDPEWKKGSCRPQMV
ncbi:hypothetical protein ACOMHN_008483 [Nucella lapillus]